MNVQFEDLMGKEWAEVWTNGQFLFLPGWRRGFDPGELRSMFFRLAQLRQLEYKVRELEAELARRDAEYTALESRAAFYRAELGDRNSRRQSLQVLGLSPNGDTAADLVRLDCRQW